MKEHQDIKGYIEEWDEQVLLYVADIDVAYTHEQQVGAGVIVAPVGLLLHRWGFCCTGGLASEHDAARHFRAAV